MTLSILLAVLLLAACAPGAGVTSSGSAHAWVDQPVTNALLPLAPFTIRGHASRPGGGIVKMAFLVNSTEVGNAGTDESAAIVSGETLWTPSAPGVYLIEVQAIGVDGASLSEASRVCVSALTDIQPLPGFLGDCGGPMPGSQSDIVPPPTVTVTETVPAPVQSTDNKGTVKENVNCHSGPAIGFPVLSYVPSGSSIELTGRSADGLWLQVKPCGQGSGWVLATFVEGSFDPAGLPVLAGPPTPTVLVPTDTSIPATFDCAAAYGSLQVTCEADPRCAYVAKTCVNK